MNGEVQVELGFLGVSGTQVEKCEDGYVYTRLYILFGISRGGINQNIGN